MASVITVGRRLIPSKDIAFVESYEPNTDLKFPMSRDFKGRVVMLNRDSILTEEPPEMFVDANGFRLLQMDRVTINPAIHFRVKAFVAADGFVSVKAYATRLLWRDLDGNDQSKLLLSEPDTVLAVVVRGEPDRHPLRLLQWGNSVELRDTGAAAVASHPANGQWRLCASSEVSSRPAKNLGSLRSRHPFRSALPRLHKAQKSNACHGLS